MASSYSTDLKLELQVTGENAGTWGDKTNVNLELIEQAIAGVESIALTDGGTVALVMSQEAVSNARNMVLKLTGTLTGASILTCPDSIEKFYIVDATAVTGATNLTFKTASGTGFTLDQAKIYAAYSDGTNINEVSLDTLGGTVGTAGIADSSITAAKLSTNAVTTAKIADNAITTAKISANQITTAKISDNQVTAAKLDDVLTDSGGTAGSYTSVNISVDAQGRITGVASGSAGAGGLRLKVFQTGPASGTYTANPGANKAVFFAAGGGGGNGGTMHSGNPGGTGGNAGAYGYFVEDVTGGTGYPYTVGAGGSNGSPNPDSNTGPGSAGGTTNVGNFFTITGGNGGNGARRSPPFPGGNPGNPGTLTGTYELNLFNTGWIEGSSYPANVGESGGNTGVLVIYDNSIT